LKELETNFRAIIIIVIVSLASLFKAGFDHDVVYYLLALGLGGMAIISGKSNHGIGVSKNSPLVFFAIFVLWSALSFVWSIHYVRTIIELLQLVLVGLVFFVSFILDDEGKYKTITIVGLVSSLIALLGILEYIFISSGRIVSTFTNPNPFGTYLLILFLFYWGFTLRDTRKSLIAVSLIFIVSFFLTGSRGAYFALTIAIPILFLGIEKASKKAAVLKTVLIIGSGLGITRILMFVAPIIQKNLGLDLSIIDNLLRISSLIGSSSFGRLEFWKTALRVTVERPLTGYGLGTFFQSYYIGYGGNQWFSRFAHNHYLQTLAELGIVGFILFIAFIISTLYVFWKVYKSREYPHYFIGIIAAFIGFLAHIFIEFSWNFPAVTVTMFWMLGMGVGLDKFDGSFFVIKPIQLRIVSIMLLCLTIWQFGSNKAYLIGIEYAEQGRIEESTEVFKLINSVYPINSNGFKLEAENYYRLFSEDKDETTLQESILLMEKAITRAPYNSELHSNLGKLYQIKGDFSKAEEHYLIGVRYASYVTNRYVDLAQFYVATEEYDKAEDILLRADELKEFMIRSADSSMKDTITFNTAAINIMLYEVYSKLGVEEKIDEQRKELIKIGEELEMFWQYYDKTRFGL